MKYVVSCLIALLVVLHQDYWQWNNDTLVGGVLPWSLAYHGSLCIAAATVWSLATRFCWPADVDNVLSGPDPEDPPPSEAATFEGRR